MAQIKGKNTLPEIMVRKFLFGKGFRYRINDKSLPGKPDIVLPKYRTVIFVNGCFWHGHADCKYADLPKTRTEWWKTKIDKNKERDNKVHLELKKSRWDKYIRKYCTVIGKNLFRKSEKTKMSSLYFPLGKSSGSRTGRRI